MSHVFPIRVYYEDTDMGGIVYHANYLKYAERARSDWVRGLGVDQRALKEAGLAFAVRRIECDYLGPARLDDLLEVRSTTEQVTAARLVMQQRVFRGDDLLFSARVTIVCITDAGRPGRLPANIRRLAP